MNLWVDGPAISWKFASVQDEDIVGPFLRHLIHRLKNFSIDRMAVFWDDQRSPRRLAIHPGYKANRKERKGKSPEDDRKVKDQMDLMRLRAFPALGIPQVKIAGHEADDLIYAACQVFKDGSTIILSTDQDFVQLVGPTVSVILDLSSGPKIISERTIRDLMRVKSGSHFLLKRLITGDHSDHIPGIGGIGSGKGKHGDKAKIWPILAKCRSLTDLFNRREELRQDPAFKLVFKPKAIQNLMRNVDLMDLSVGEGSDPNLQSLVMTEILEGVREISVASIYDALNDNPSLASETLSSLPYFDRVVSRMLGE